MIGKTGPKKTNGKPVAADASGGNRNTRTTETKTTAKSKKAELILAGIDSLFHQAEKSNPNQDVTYLDVVRIADYVKVQLASTPSPEVDATLEIAVGLCHPERLEAISQLKNGIGALVGLGGGASLLWGILTIIAHGVIMTTVAGSLWWKTSVVSILFGGPIGIALGVASIAAGIYLLSRQVSAKRRAITALDVMRKAITTWGQSPRRVRIVGAKWIGELSEKEYAALLSLCWYLFNCDERIDEQELAFVNELIKLRQPTNNNIATGIGIMSVEDATGVLRDNKHASDAIRLLRRIPSVDGETTEDEREAFKELCRKLRRG